MPDALLDSIRKLRGVGPAVAPTTQPTQPPYPPQTLSAPAPPLGASSGQDNLLAAVRALRAQGSAGPTPLPPASPITGVRGPTGAYMTRDQLIRRTRLHQMRDASQPIEQRLDPNAMGWLGTQPIPTHPLTALGAFGAQGSEELLNLARNVATMPGVAGPATRAGLESVASPFHEEFVKPLAEASPTGAMAGQFAGQAPAYMLAGPVGEAMGPAMGLGGRAAKSIGGAVADTLASQASLPPDASLAERGQQAVVAPAMGLAMRAGPDALLASVRRLRGVEAPAPSLPTDMPQGVNLEAQTAGLPPFVQNPQAAAMSARLPGEGAIPGNVGPQGEMGGRQLYNEPGGSTKAAPTLTPDEQARAAYVDQAEARTAERRAANRPTNADYIDQLPGLADHEKAQLKHALELQPDKASDILAVAKAHSAEAVRAAEAVRVPRPPEPQMALPIEEPLPTANGPRRMQPPAPESLPGGRGEPTAIDIAPAPEGVSQIPRAVREHSVDKIMQELGQEPRAQEPLREPVGPTATRPLTEMGGPGPGEEAPPGQQARLDRMGQMDQVEEPSRAASIYDTQPIRPEPRAPGPNAEIVNPNTAERGSGLKPPTLTDIFKRRIIGAARERARANAPGGGTGTLPTVEIDSGPPDLGLSAYIRTPLNNLKRFGAKVRSAIEDITLTGDKIQRETERQVNERLSVYESLPRRMRKQYAGAMADIIDGNTAESIAARTDLPQQVKDVAIRLKEFFEADRKEFIAHAKAQGFEVPENWGIRDYLPHVFPGEYRLGVRGPEGEITFIGSATTKLEAMKKIADYHAAHPEVPAESYAVGKKPFAPPDITRVSTPNRWRIINELADRAEVSPQDVKDAMRGVLGTKEAKSKFWGNTLKRTGAEGWSRDMDMILRTYTRNKIRHFELTDLNRRVAPVLRELRANGQSGLADELESNFQQLWGVRSPAARALDATLERMPGINRIHRYGSLERWTGRLRSGTSKLMLFTPRFNLLNRLQVFQTLWPTVSTGEFARGLKLWASKEGRAILETHGLAREGKFNEGDFLSHIGSSKFRAMKRTAGEFLNSETANQEIAFLTLYDKARKTGMSPEDAARHGRLRGQFFTQFLGSPADAPRIMRGPIGKTIFQFKRFQIKNIELAFDLLQSKDYPGVAKWLGANLLLGGAKVGIKYGAPVLGALALAKRAAGQRDQRLEADGYLTLQMYDSIKREYGESVANGIMFGLPGLVGMDMSNSVQLLDIPNGKTLSEKSGNLLLGPPGQLAASAIQAFNSVSGPTDTSGGERAAKALVTRLPVLKMLDGVRRVLTSDYNWNSPDGKLKYRGDMTEALLQAGAFRSVDRAKADLFADATFEISKARSEAISKAAQGDRKAAWRWNALFPEFPILAHDLDVRAKSQRALAAKPQVQRLGAPQSLKRQMQGMKP